MNTPWKRPARSTINACVVPQNDNTSTYASAFVNFFMHDSLGFKFQDGGVVIWTGGSKLGHYYWHLERNIHNVASKHIVVATDILS